VVVEQTGKKTSTKGKEIGGERDGRWGERSASLVDEQLEVNGSDSVAAVVNDVSEPCLAFNVNQHSRCKRN
jgi:hypothetical protein